MTLPPNTFKYYYNNLNLADKQAFMDQVRQALNISESTFYRRLNNPDLFNPTEREKLAQITGISQQTLFNLQTA